MKECREHPGGGINKAKKRMNKGSTNFKKVGIPGHTELKANVGLSRAEQTWIKRIQEALSFDLLSRKYRGRVSPFAHYVTGHCCVATEAAYYLFAKDSGYKPHVKKLGDVTHWWLFHPERKVILDVTAPQADGFVYGQCEKWQPFQGHGKPSKRALSLMIRVLLASPKTNRTLLENVLNQAKEIST